MRIGIEAQRIFRRKKHGMDIYALQLIRHLQRIDHRNEYFIFVRSGEDVCLKPSTNFEIVCIEAVNYADWEQIWLSLSVSKYKLDLLHCTSNTAPLFCSIPTVVTLHDIMYLNPSFAGGSLYQKMGHYYRKWIVPRAYHRAAKVVTVSAFEAGTIKNHFRDASANKVEVAYNGLNPTFNKTYDVEERGKVRRELKLPDHYLLFLGNTAPKKNMKRVLEAYAKYRFIHNDALPLVIVDTDEKTLAKMLSALGLSQYLINIHCVGYVSNDRLPIVYQEASLFLYPSIRESFGIPIIEAMASGTPVIAADTSSMPEIGQEAVCYVNPLSTSSLAKAMTALLKDKRRLLQMKKQGYDRAKKFTWTHTAQQMLATYCDIVC